MSPAADVGVGEVWLTERAAVAERRLLALPDGELGPAGRLLRDALRLALTQVSSQPPAENAPLKGVAGSSSSKQASVVQPPLMLAVPGEGSENIDR